MPIQILMPALSPTMEEGTLAKWLVKEGDDVVESRRRDRRDRDRQGDDGGRGVDEGKVGKILVGEGTEGVKVNDVIAVLLEDGEDDDIGDVAAGSAPASAAERPPPMRPPLHRSARGRSDGSWPGGRCRAAAPPIRGDLTRNTGRKARR